MRCAVRGTAVRRAATRSSASDFENGEPVGFERFLEGFLFQRENGKYGYLGRLAAAAPKPFTHWIAYDLPAGLTSLREGLPTEPVLADIEGAKPGTNSRGSTGYFGPKPPVGDPPHNYHFQVFALDLAELGLPPGAPREEVLKAMHGHVLAEGEIVGTYAGPRVRSRRGVAGPIERGLRCKRARSGETLAEPGFAGID